MLRSLSRAFAQLSDPRLRGVVLTSVGATLLLVAAVTATVWSVIDGIGLVGIGWIDGVLASLGAIAVFVATMMLFPAITNVVSGLFVDRVADAVESTHYPALGEGRAVGVGESLASALRLFAAAVALNLLVLPLYIFVPGLNLVLFYGLNGWLLGREYMEIVAGRRMEPAEFKTFRKTHSGAVFLTGVIIAVIASIPVLNLAAPVIGTAFAVHRFQDLRAAAHAA